MPAMIVFFSTKGIVADFNSELILEVKRYFLQLLCLMIP